MIPANQIKQGMVIKLESRLFGVLSFTHTKPGKGGAYLRLKLKDISSGQVLEKTISTDEKVEDVFVEERKLIYLYYDGERYNFMDEKSYEQIELTPQELEEVKFYLKENEAVTATFYQGKIISISPPIFVELKVVETEPGYRGDTVKAGSKPAKLESGLILQVPLFINNGDVVKVDTRTGEYVERV